MATVTYLGGGTMRFELDSGMDLFISEAEVIEMLDALSDNDDMACRFEHTQLLEAAVGKLARFESLWMNFSEKTNDLFRQFGIDIDELFKKGE